MSGLRLQPFAVRHRADASVLAVSAVGDFSILSSSEFQALVGNHEELSTARLAELQAKFFLMREDAAGAQRLFKSRVLARQGTVSRGPTLHIVVPTLHCEHSCQYCQVSRSLDSTGVSLSEAAIDDVCETILQSPNPDLTVEFQGGDPLLRFDLVERALTKLDEEASRQGKRISFVIASTLHQLTDRVCEVLARHRVHVSTSIDGPADLHNRNRPLPTRDSYERTVTGIELARSRLGRGSVAALATITRAALGRANDVVDDYVRLGLEEVCLRPLSPYGFARPGRRSLGLNRAEYQEFYREALGRVFEWNRSGTALREGQAAVALNKLLSPIDAGYVDLQSVPGGGAAALIYNYDGFVYPSDEARMLAETGNQSLRLGAIGQPLSELLEAPILSQMRAVGSSSKNETCRECAFQTYCGPDLTEAVAVFGRMDVPPESTEHCQRSQWLFDLLLDEWITGDEAKKRLLRQWAQPRKGG